jgi:hypothetical protein
MKQQALAIAAATMLTVGLGLANASEQSGTLDQSVAPDMSACSSDHSLCPTEEMINEDNQLSQSGTEGAMQVGQQNESINDTFVEEQAEDTDTATAEQASDESRVPDVIIFVQ